jgi:plasmid stabilization system protein ParE
MKTKTTKTRDTTSWALPGDPISLEEFRAGIKEAEKGPFYTLDECKKNDCRMEKEKKLPVRLTLQFNIDLDNVYKYGIETFGLKQAELYENEIWKLVHGLSLNWAIFSECRHLLTKSKMYRWIILDSHLIIYRLTAT